jgi:hypothetical protein
MFAFFSSMRAVTKHKVCENVGCSYSTCFHYDTSATAFIYIDRVMIRNVMIFTAPVSRQQICLNPFDHPLVVASVHNAFDSTTNDKLPHKRDSSNSSLGLTFERIRGPDSHNSTDAACAPPTLTYLRGLVRDQLHLNVIQTPRGSKILLKKCTTLSIQYMRSGTPAALHHTCTMSKKSSVPPASTLAAEPHIRPDFSGPYCT